MRARLVELDLRNVTFARTSTSAANLEAIEIVQADAGTTGAYVGAVPANIVLSCGVFGNITGDDILRTIRAFPTLCAEGAAVIWTRNRLPPDLTPKIRTWFREAGFDEEAFSVPDGTVFGVGVHRFAQQPQPFESDRRLFTFVGYDQILGKSE